MPQPKLRNVRYYKAKKLKELMFFGRSIKFSKKQYITPYYFSFLVLSLESQSYKVKATVPPKDHMRLLSECNSMMQAMVP